MPFAIGCDAGVCVFSRGKAGCWVHTGVVGRRSELTPLWKHHTQQSAVIFLSGNVTLTPWYITSHSFSLRLEFSLEVHGVLKVSDHKGKA